MSERKDAGERLTALMSALADQAESLSDETLLKDATAAGIDVKTEATRVRSLLLAAVVRAKKERLTAALAAHRQAVAGLASRATRVPHAASERRALLMQTLERRPQMKEAVVTLQHREFTSFSDADVESVLKQLDALGLLDDDSEPNR